MPLYEYECEACGKRFELIRKFSDPPVEVCTMCGRGPVRRLLSSPAIQFKGSGWYITDYAQKGKGKSEKSDTSTADKSADGKSDSPTKAESATKSDAPAKSSSSSTTKE